MKLEEYVIAADKLVNRVKDPVTFDIVSCGTAIAALRESQDALSSKLEALSQKLQDQARHSKDAEKRIEKNDAAMLLLSNCHEVLDERLQENPPLLEEIKRDILWIHYIHQRVLASIKRQEARSLFMCQADEFMQTEASFIKNVQKANQSAKKILSRYRDKLLKKWGSEKIDTITRLVYLSEMLTNHFEMSEEDKEKYQKIPQSIVLFLMGKFFSDGFKLQLRNLIILLHAQDELMAFFQRIHEKRVEFTVDDSKMLPELESLCNDILLSGGFAFHQRPPRYELLLNNLKDNIQRYSQYAHPVYQPMRQGVPISSHELVGMLTKTIQYIKDSMAIHAREDELAFFKKAMDDKMNAFKPPASSSTWNKLLKKKSTNKKEFNELSALRDRLFLYREGMVAKSGNDSAKKQAEVQDMAIEYGAVTAIKEIISGLAVETMWPITESVWVFCRELLSEAKKMIGEKPDDRIYAQNYITFQRFLAQHAMFCVQMGIKDVEDLFLRKPSQNEMTHASEVMLNEGSDVSKKPEVLATDALKNAITSLYADEPSTIITLDEVGVERSLEGSVDMPEEVEMNEELLTPPDPEKAYTLGDACEKAMDYERAENYYFLASEAGHRLAHYRLATLYERGLSCNPDAYRHVLDLYLRAARRDWQAPVEVYYALGRIYAQKSQYFKAKEYYDHAANQGYPPAQYALGRLYEEGMLTLGEGQRVEMWYKRAVASSKGTLQGARIESKGKAAATSDRILNTLELERLTADAHYRIGKIYEAKGSDVAARVSYEHALKIMKSGYAPAEVRLGVLAEKSGKYVEALSHYEAALSTACYTIHAFSSLTASDRSTFTPPDIAQHNIYIDFDENAWMMIYSTDEVFRGVLPENHGIKPHTDMTNSDFKVSVLSELARVGAIEWGAAQAYERMGALYGAGHPGIAQDLKKASHCFLKASKMRGEDNSPETSSNEVLAVDEGGDMKNGGSWIGVQKRSVSADTKGSFWKKAEEEKGKGKAVADSETPGP